MKIVVLGNGTMGAGIAQTMAQKSLEVTMKGRSTESLGRAMARMEKGLNRQVDKGRMTAEDRDAILARITTTTDFEQVKDADLVIEAVSEEMEVKKEILTHLCSILQPEAIIATNTSSLYHRASSGYQATREGDRYALLQPRASDETGRGDHRPAH